MSAVMRRRLGPWLVGAMLAGVACGPSRAPYEPLELEEFIGTFALDYCHRIYTCCNAVDLPTVSPGTSETTCTAEMTGFARANATFLLAHHGIVFDPAKAASCLALLEGAACSTIFEPRFGALVACQDIFPGSLAAGEECDDDHECASARCDSGECRAGAPPACSDEQFLDETRDVCIQRHELGAPCTLPTECLNGAACVHDVCVEPLADGLACEGLLDCEGTCAATQGQYLCRPGYCRGHE
jgi:hypothetical protein